MLGILLIFYTYMYNAYGTFCCHCAKSLCFALPVNVHLLCPLILKLLNMKNLPLIAHLHVLVLYMFNDFASSLICELSVML